MTEGLADALAWATARDTHPEALNGAGVERRAGADGGPDGLERAARAALGLPERDETTDDGSTT